MWRKAGNGKHATLSWRICHLIFEKHDSFGNFCPITEFYQLFWNVNDKSLILIALILISSQHHVTRPVTALEWAILLFVMDRCTIFHRATQAAEKRIQRARAQFFTLTAPASLNLETWRMATVTLTASLSWYFLWYFWPWSRFLRLQITFRRSSSH